MLATAIAGGNPPDMADIAQPGLVKQFADQGHLKPITYAKPVIAANFAPAWQKLGTLDGKLYGLVFKAANKSTLWYNVPAFKAAGVKAPKTWAQMLSGRQDAPGVGHARVLDRRSGRVDAHRPVREPLPPHVRPGEVQRPDARTRSSGRDSVGDNGLKMMGRCSATPRTSPAARAGRSRPIPDSVTNAFATPPKAAMVFEGDFVAGVILSSTKAKAGTGFNAFAVPAITNPVAGRERRRDRRRPVRHLP